MWVNVLGLYAASTQNHIDNIVVQCSTIKFIRTFDFRPKRMKNYILYINTIYYVPAFVFVLFINFKRFLSVLEAS